MKKLKHALLGMAMVVGAASCTIGHSYQTTGYPVGENPKVGVAKLALFSPNKDITIKRAAEEGGITKIAAVDVEYKYFIFPIYKTTVIGQ